jgi:hypothetical protein
MRKFMETTEQVTETEAEHTESLKTLDEQAIEDPNLVSEVQDKLSRLSDLNELTKDEDFNRLGGKKETATSDEEDDDLTPEVKDGTNAEDSDQADDQTGSDDLTPEAESKSDDIEIPDAYIRAAIHRGWTQEVVDDFVKSNPELALKALEATYLEVNNASRDWAERGRAAIEDERKATSVQATTETVAQEDPKKTALVAKLRKEYADDPLVEVVISELEKPVQQPKPQPVQQQQAQYETATRRANAATNVAIDQRINTFFSADVMKPYEKFYGKLELGQVPEDLANGQQLNRLAVIEETECIIAGHNMRNQKIELEQAMEKAHFIVTEHIKEQVIRDNLKVTATKRKKGMTFRPSDSKRSSDSLNTESSKPRNRSELELSVQQNLDRVFKS